MFGGDFEGAGKPAGEGAIEEGVADEEHEEDRQKREAHGADDHLGLEAGAQLLAAALHPETEDGAAKNEEEDEQSRSDKGGNREERKKDAPALRFKGYIQRTQSENGGEKERQNNAGEHQTEPLFGFGSHREVALGLLLAGGR